MNQDNPDDKNTFRIDREKLPQGDPEVLPWKKSVLNEGTWVGGRYQMAEFIGRGAFSDVYRARDSLLHRWVALKLYATDVSLSVARDEIEWQGRIQHPNLMPILDAGADPAQGRYFVAMPLYPGETLDSLLNRMGPLPVKIALVYGDQILSALDFINRGRGGIHGDIKPSNIWVTRDGSAVLMDYGIAAVAEEGDRVGTPGYAAPETPGGTADIRSDIFSVGCVFYFMLTGLQAFTGDHDVLVKSLTPPSALRSDLRLYLDQIVLKAVDRHPDNRYQSAREMQNALRHPPLWERLQRRPHARFSLFRASLSLMRLLTRAIAAAILRPRRTFALLLGAVISVVIVAALAISGTQLAVQELSFLNGRYPVRFALLLLAVGSVAAWYLGRRPCRGPARFWNAPTIFWDVFLSLISPGLGSLNAGSFLAGVAFLSGHSLFMLTWWLPGAYREMVAQQMWIFLTAITVWIASLIHLLYLTPDPARGRKSTTLLSLLLGAAFGAAAAAPLHIPHLFAESLNRMHVLSGLPVAATIIAGIPAGVLASVLAGLLLAGEGMTGSFLMWQIAAICLACGLARALSRARKSLGALGCLFANMESASLWSGSSIGWLWVLQNAGFWEETLVQMAVAVLAIELGCADSWLRGRLAGVRAKRGTHPAPSVSKGAQRGNSENDRPSYRFR